MKNREEKNGEGKGYKYVNNDPSKIIEVPNTHEAIITQNEFDEARALLKRNRTNGVVRFRNNVYHLSGILKCNECGGKSPKKLRVLLRTFGWATVGFKELEDSLREAGMEMLGEGTYVQYIPDDADAGNRGAGKEGLGLKGAR